MPQSTQSSLIHILLLWITILSIIQTVFIILFFTAGHHGMFQNSSAVAPEHTVQSQANDAPSLPPVDNGLLLGKGQMVTYKATEVNGKIKWEAKNPSIGLISEEGEDLKIKMDGYYLLNLQVTVKRSTCLSCGTRRSECMVSLLSKNQVLLQGEINKNTCSTGLLGKVEVLSAGSILEFIINLPNNEINETESVTHLDIVYMFKP